MAVLGPAGIHTGQFPWPDQAVGYGEEPLQIGPEDWPECARAVRARALAETSAAFAAGGLDLDAVCQELADRLASVLVGDSLIRPVGFGGAERLPVALGPRGSNRKLARVVEADPWALAAACSARAVEMGRSILLPELSVKCLRLWSAAAAWPSLDELGIGSMVVAPVRAGGRPLGSMLVWRAGAGPPLGTWDQLFVKEVAARLAAAYR
ncbi:MAG TPA: GAF domain-containing protein [Chloroflexota bacterium]|nr:GAF domain-containing protein [Chloroflexota bacterium]